MAPAKWIGGTNFGDSLPKLCPSCPLSLMKEQGCILPGTQVKSRD